MLDSAGVDCSSISVYSKHLPSNMSRLYTAISIEQWWNNGIISSGRLLFVGAAKTCLTLHSASLQNCLFCLLFYLKLNLNETFIMFVVLLVRFLLVLTVLHRKIGYFTPRVF